VKVKDTAKVNEAGDFRERSLWRTDAER